MHAGRHLLHAERRHHRAHRLFVLLLGAGPLLACFPFGAREWPPPNSLKDVPGLTLLTPGENASFQNPTWSPDGRYLAYDLAFPPIGATRPSFPADAEIYVMDLETGSRRQLTDNNVADVDPDWSPDGERVVFVRAAEDSGYPPSLQLVLIPAEGSREQILIECPSPCVRPKWSPDGELLAFAMEEAIWTIRRDGSDLRQVSGEKVTAATYPDWSPDGSRLVYWATLEATSVAKALRGNLAVLDLTTGEETIVFSGVSPLNPDWSPVGSSILFSDQPAPQKEWTLFTLDLEAGVAQRLIPLDLEYGLFDAVWSQDVKRIAFAFGMQTTASHLYILDLEQFGALTPEPTAGP